MISVPPNPSDKDDPTLYGIPQKYAFFKLQFEITSYVILEWGEQEALLVLD